MKTVHQILTVIFWITLALGGFKILQSFSSNLPFSVLIGYALGNLLLPAILWIAMYYVRKNILGNDSNSKSNLNDENMV